MLKALFLSFSVLIIMGCGSYVNTENENPIVVDSRFRATPVIAMKVATRSTPKDEQDSNKKYIQNYEILDKKIIDNDDFMERIQQALSDPDNHADEGMRCFEPGLAFRFGEQKEATELVICLHCYWAYIYSKGDLDRKALSKQGVNRLANLYKEIFP